MSSRNDYEANKKKRRGKRFWSVLGGFLALLLCCTAVMTGISYATKGFTKTSWFDNTRNPDNLIVLDDSYIKTMDTNRGVEIDVKEDGTIKLSGEASSDYTVVVATVNLEPGKYTFSGMDDPVIPDCYLYLTYGVAGQAIAGTENATFELDSAQNVVIKLTWKEGTKFNWLNVNKIQPVLVEGTKSGSFYAE